MKKLIKSRIFLFTVMLLFISIISCSKDKVTSPATGIPEISSLLSYTTEIEVELKETTPLNKFEIQYSTNEDMSNANSKVLSSNPLNISKLKASTEYYIRVRANGGDSWTEIKKAKTANFETIVTTFNLFSSIYDYKFPNNRWNSRKEATRDIILESNTDILGIQEGMAKSHVSDIASLLSTSYASYISDRDISGRAIFWKRDKYSLVEYDDIDAFDSSISKHKSQRYVSYVRLKEKATNKDIIVFTGHAPTGSDVETQRVRGILANKIARKAKELSIEANNAPVVILADLNNYPETVIGGLSSAPMVFEENGFKDTFNATLNKINPNYKTHDGIESGVVTMAQNGSKRIDYIFTYPEERVSVSDYEIVIDFENGSSTILKKPIPSDHRPVKSTLHLFY